MAPVIEFEARRGRLFGLAYRLLGSVEEAEDAVQDAYLRWDRTDRATIEHPDAWLTKVVTNLCLTRLTAARATREQYIGEWLPAPVPTDQLGPLETVEQRDSVSFAMLALLERLTPPERAVFVLREAFGYGHRDIAEVMGLSEANCRQLHRRAAKHLADRKPRFQPARETRERLAARFLSAAQSGDLRALEDLLAADVTSWADSNGRLPMARRPVIGRDRVVRYFTGAWRKAPGNLEFTCTEVNGGTAIAVHAGGLLAVLALEFDGEAIAAVRIVANPAKLSHLRVPASP
ncbi:RNA polymerase ECF family sigma subunit [Tamaricihabitans halophyticus]|uniref:RNA polymerase ECF family sigma subunit n=1 Tax=Tamaricihabitans halophyticus TaxID=1262583 RepID=A0A4V2SSM4_9PSEU|nr:RNA polymerase sigma-70 factor [Tamaricihabitans halophyticus]TCP47306.1 RNA polymerase ECF family sigma subunit [Tamaricihabitans halophyticus]